MNWCVTVWYDIEEERDPGDPPHTLNRPPDNYWVFSDITHDEAIAKAIQYADYEEDEANGYKVYFLAVPLQGTPQRYRATRVVEVVPV